MKEKVKHYAKEIVVFFVLLTIFANIISFLKSSDLNKQQLSNINLELIDNSFYNYDTSKPILVHFWATWCPTCKLEAPNIQTISENFQVVTIAVKSNSNQEIQEYLNERDLTFKVHNDREGVLSSKYKVMAYPTTFIYNKDGKLVFSEVGYTSTWGLWLRIWWAGL